MLNFMTFMRRTSLMQNVFTRFAKSIYVSKTELENGFHIIERIDFLTISVTNLYTIKLLPYVENLFVCSHWVREFSSSLQQERHLGHIRRTVVILWTACFLWENLDRHTFLHLSISL